MSKITADTIRLLAADMVQKANSGHPGLPMGMADCATVLWTQFLKYNPQDPEWQGRDRFVMSGGHGSSLLYAVLHLAGYDISLEDLKNFRQWNSKTPGHPESHLPGVETTTGPLGQGLANAVGLALAARMSAAQWNNDNFNILGNHYTYCFCGDGDMMEGISHEASSLAGHLGLGKLICFYDSNSITIDGSTNLTFTEDVAMRFRAYHWHVQEIDGHDHEKIAKAIKMAQAELGKPSLIIAKTHIGFGSPNKQDSSAAHGAPLGEEELRLTKKALNFPENESFKIPDEVKIEFQAYQDTLTSDYESWQSVFKKWKSEAPDTYEKYIDQINKKLPKDLSKTILSTLSGKDNSTRAHSGNILQELVKQVSGLVGGSADLSASDKTTLKGKGYISRDDFSGKNIHYGIREFAMGAVMNGMALYGSGLIPYAGTFLVFSDYMRSAIRMSALMKNQVIYVFTHDSIFVGEDGPTHQPIEQIMSLRLIPGLQVIRPADEKETAEAWLAALKYQNGPTALILTRQDLPELHKNDHCSITDFDKGAHVIKDTKMPPEAVILASGSELSLCVDAAEKLAQEGCNIRVVSVPSYETFLMQEQSYRDSVSPPGSTPVVTVEAGRTLGWGNVSTKPVLHIGIDHYGASAPHQILAEKFGFTAEAVYNKVKAWLATAKAEISLK
ncbi:MAG: transketolase [Candidatus Marinimicrobia bacterium]|nr:transketolase [Candidatus Neomarinimicrobiota bacterium]